MGKPQVAQRTLWGGDGTASATTGEQRVAGGDAEPPPFSARVHRGAPDLEGDRPASVGDPGAHGRLGRADGSLGGGAVSAGGVRGHHGRCNHYLPQGHWVEMVSSSDVRQALWRPALLQNWVREAPAVFVITALYERTEHKYGSRAEQYVKLEAGHACQNLLLQAVALDLGAVPVGAFYDDQVQAALGLAADHKPLYLVPVGHPR